jgi:hypothetical protein
MPLKPSSALLDSQAQHDAGVLDRVVHVDMQVALGLDLQVEAAVAREALQHMVVETDAGGDRRGAGPVEIDPDPDLGLLRLADHFSGAGHGLP